MINPESLTAIKDNLAHGIQPTGIELDLMIRSLEELLRNVAEKAEGLKADDVVFRQETKEIYDQMAEIDKYKAVVKAARELIYPPRIVYAAGSKKAALRDALLALEDNRPSPAGSAPA